jgi:glycopeptide antibiotics resistance protein
MGSRKLTIALLVFYLFVISWMILLKTRFSFALVDTRRSLNLIPFGAMAIRNGMPNYNEVFLNILVFVPLGVFICMLNKKKTFVNLVVPIVVLSLSFEVIQYIFAMGASDITDVIANTFGGLVGIGVFSIFHKIFKESASKIFNVIVMVLAIGLALLIGVARFWIAGRGRF